jgi:prophage antirepressor-like protein
LNELKIFNNQEFGEIRAIEIQGEPWLVGKDVTDKLGYQNGSRDIVRHVDEEDRAGIAIHDGRQERTMVCVNESGLYSLILGSKLPTAKKFKHWVTSEVLPSIRKTGAYKLPLSKKDEMKLYLEALEEQDLKIEEVKKDLQEFKQDMPVLGVECDKITFAVKKKGVECLGGKESAAYQDKSLRGKIYSDIHSQVKREFAVTTYKAIKRSQVELAVNIIGAYKVPFALKNEIEQCNNQMFISA